MVDTNAPPFQRKHYCASVLLHGPQAKPRLLSPRVSCSETALPQTPLLRNCLNGNGAKLLFLISHFSKIAIIQILCKIISSDNRLVQYFYVMLFSYDINQYKASTLHSFLNVLKHAKTKRIEENIENINFSVARDPLVSDSIRNVNTTAPRFFFVGIKRIHFLIKELFTYHWKRP